MSKFEDILLPFLEQAEQTASQDPTQKGLRFILHCLVDIHLSKGEPEDVAMAKQILERLRDTVDKIRSNYWQWRLNKLP